MEGAVLSQQYRARMKANGKARVNNGRVQTNHEYIQQLKKVRDKGQEEDVVQILKETRKGKINNGIAKAKKRKDESR